MRKIYVNLACFFIVTLANSLALATIHTGYPHSVIPWGYVGDAGPTYWWQLSHEFHTCHSGKKQSPINFTRAQIKKGDKDSLSFHYHATHPKIVNIGKTIRLLFSKKDKETIRLDGVTYYLENIHLHTPSEHTIDGQRYPMEFHMVHVNKKGDHMVIAVPVRYGQDNTVLAQIAHHVPRRLFDEHKLKHKKINPEKLIPLNDHYYHYVGSFTTPPCTEGVQWVVFQHGVTAEMQQVLDFQMKYSQVNARPVQQTHHRKITLSRS